MTEGKMLLKTGGIALAVYVATKYLLPYVIPFLIAYILVHLLNPVTVWIRKRIRWKKELIAAVLMLLFLSLFTVLFYWLYCVLTEQIRRIVLNFDLYYDCFCRMIDGCCVFAEKKFGIHVDEMRRLVYNGINYATDQIRVYLVPEVVNYSVRSLKKLVDAGLFLLILFVSTILLMKDYDEMKERLQGYRLYVHFHRIVKRMWRQGGMYLKAQGIIILIITLICTAGLWMIGNPYFLVLGIVIGLTDALPFIGTGTVLLPTAAVFLIGGNYQAALGYAVLFVVTYFTREFLEPRLIGAKLGIYPFVMIVVVYAGLYLYGPAGVFLGPVSLLAVMEIKRECGS